MVKLIMALMLAAGVTGCAGHRMPELASCDGGERRALNKAQWQWQERADLGHAAKSCG